MSKNSNRLSATALDSENFRLAVDLQQLKKVAEIEATEAMVFYCGRVLEATSNYCAVQLGERAKSNVFANIEYINDFNLLDENTRHWAHALRRLANQFRHILKPTEDNDGDISVILLDMWMTWLLNRSQLVEKNTIPFEPISNQQQRIYSQFSALSDWLQHKQLEKLTGHDASDYLVQPVFASVICEELINQQDYTIANNFLNQALEQHPNDLRLQQLSGLLLSRTGKLQSAESKLRRLLKQFPNDDETIGILAGVIKKLWQNGDQDKLSQWGKLYVKGWKQSKQRNTYLGINAATYSLWSGDNQASQSIAQSIIETYASREKILRERLHHSTQQMDYWDLATLAESYLLAGDIEQAEEHYQKLFQSPSYHGKPHQVPANQLAHHLKFCVDINSDVLSQFISSF
jgi:tetratricopeptide (TPR) repeat protein